MHREVHDQRALKCELFEWHVTVIIGSWFLIIIGDRRFQDRYQSSKRFYRWEMTNSTFNRRRIGESTNKIYLDLVCRPSQWSTQIQAPIVGPGQSSKKDKCDDQSSTKRRIDHQCGSRFKSYNCLETPSGHGFQAHWVIGSIFNVKYKEYTLVCSARDDVCFITTDFTLAIVRYVCRSRNIDISPRC